MDVKLSGVSRLVSSSAPEKDIICFKMEEAGFCSLDSDGKLI